MRERTRPRWECPECGAYIHKAKAPKSCTDPKCEMAITKKTKVADEISIIQQWSRVKPDRFSSSAHTIHFRGMRGWRPLTSEEYGELLRTLATAKEKAKAKKAKK